MSFIHWPVQPYLEVSCSLVTFSLPPQLWNNQKGPRLTHMGSNIEKISKIKPVEGEQYSGWVLKNLWGALLLWFQLAISKRGFWEMLDRMEESDLEKVWMTFPRSDHERVGFNLDVVHTSGSEMYEKLDYFLRCRSSSLRQVTAAARLLWSPGVSRRYICVICLRV